MADVPNGGRIVPIVTTARQHYSSSPTNEAMANAPQQPSEKVKLPRNTRSKTMEAETLEIPCLNELGLYALPTEGDGNAVPAIGLSALKWPQLGREVMFLNRSNCQP